MRRPLSPKSDTYPERCQVDATDISEEAERITRGDLGLLAEGTRGIPVRSSRQESAEAILGCREVTEGPNQL